jgi:hypothetical protein
MQLVRAVLGVMAALSVASCKKTEAPAEPVDAQSPAAEPPPAPAPLPSPVVVGQTRCSFRPGPPAAVLRSEKAPPSGDEDTEPEAGPNLELGPAVATSEGFAVGVLRLGKTTRAELVLVGVAGQARKVELGEVHGQVDPPRLASHGGALLVALVDNDSSGHTLRLGRLDAPFTDGQVVWGPELPEGRDDSGVFSLGAQGGTGLLVWDAEQPSTARSRLLRVAFDARTLALRGPARAYESAGADVDGPFLVARPSGHWLVWSSYEVTQPSGAGEADDPWLQLRAVALDERGDFVGAPLTLGRHRVQALDVAAAADGGLLVALRPSEPELDSRTLMVVTVHPDGSMTSEASVVSELGLGAPVLLANGNQPWLGVRGQDGATLLGTVPAQGPLTLAAERPFFGREPLVAGPGGWLLAEPHGSDLDLRVAECGAKAPPAAR